MVRRSLEKRIKKLEYAARPPIITTLADFIIWCANHGDGEEMPPLNPELEAALLSIKGSQ